MRNTPAKLIVAACLSLGAQQAAMAADLPVRPAPVAFSPVHSWTGCYIGGNLGAAMAQADFSAAASASGSSTNFTAGLQIGCDYQTGAFVFGIRNMVNWTDINGSASFAAPGAGFVGTSNMSWFDTLTGRVGYAVQPSWLLYVQGGAAWSRITQFVTSPGGAISGQFTGTHTGWTIGAGTEYLLSPNWSVFLEYNYADFGNASGVVTGLGTVNGRMQMQTVLVGLNWRWNAAPLSLPGRY